LKVLFLPAISGEELEAPSPTIIDKKIVLYYKAQLESTFLISTLERFIKTFSRDCKSYKTIVDFRIILYY
jgi:hypothetical protein